MSAVHLGLGDAGLGLRVKSLKQRGAWDPGDTYGA